MKRVTKSLAVPPPVEPMLAKIAAEIPRDGNFLFEPKWDGFRAIVFRDKDSVFIQSRDLRPLDRYFPELHAICLEQLPAGVVVDGEIVMPTPHGLDFGGLQMRLHPAASRVEKLAKATPAAFVAFDLLAADGKSLMNEPQEARRASLEKLFKKIHTPLYLTPMTRDRALAVDWLNRFEGAGLDGVVAKPATATYQPGKRAMFKIKHSRTADCVVAGFRWHKSGKGAVGSLLLGLYDDEGLLEHIGFTSNIPRDEKPALTRKLEKLIAPPGFTGGKPGGPSRWSTERSAEWVPLKPKLVVEVCYDHFSGERFRHGTRLLRWRPDKAPAQCTMEQVKQKKADLMKLLK
jgi:ATP-dependent DNA ligase